MGAPNVSYTINKNKISSVSGFDFVQVTFSADSSYKAFECRATKTSEEWGIGKGMLVASFSQTPANVTRTFEVYDDFLVKGDGEYRISLYVQGEDGAWNDTFGFIPSGTTKTMITSDGKQFLCRKG